jgi:UDPglucose--hexose-1-phosphate uridylyltransferase
MPELRQNFFTKEWVIVATERAKRPEELATHRPVKTVPSFVDTCVFCPGHEDKTPPEVMRVPSDRDASWQVRIVPNKFGALSRDAEPTRVIRRSHRTMEGFGVHDVIIDTPDHSEITALMPDAHVANVLRAYKSRYDVLSHDPRIAHITIFKNHGAEGGASLEHPHSQLVATPVISNQIRGRLEEALRHYDAFGDCMFCEVVQQELEDPQRIVLTTEHFVALEPFASPTPFSTHIYPRRHMANFGDISAAETTDLARTLKTVLAKLYHGLDNPDFNDTIRSAPAEWVGARYFHWYMSITPRLTRVAGFELGSGMFINTVLPEAAAEFLRNVKLGLGMAAGAG